MGGTYTVAAANGAYVETTAGAVNASGVTSGGTIAINAGALFSSGTQTAAASAGSGGNITLTANSINLVSAMLDASGATGGGAVRVGGDFHGDGTLSQATTTYISPGTVITADATKSGNGGSVVAWSDQTTTFYGAISAKGGPQGGNGGTIEVSSKNQLIFGGAADASAPKGTTGTVLLDPQNIVIDNTTGIYAQYQLIDPVGGSGDLFSQTVQALPNGNVVVTAPGTTIGGQASAGAVYLFNGVTGALISSLTGTRANDQVGANPGLSSSSVVALTNGNFVVTSPFWNSNTGAATWGSGTSGVAGVVSASNSLIGSNSGNACGTSGSGDCVGAVNDAYSGIIALTNGNYVVSSPAWNSGAGAVTWGNGATGTSGAVSALNSLVGSTATDAVGNGGVTNGNGGVTSLTNGNYVVASPNWNTNTGAVTWGNGTTGVTGTITSSNSLIGSLSGAACNIPGAGDCVGSGGVLALTNGNYVVGSPSWNSAAGAATWGNGTTGVHGTISASNSLVGSTGGNASCSLFSSGDGDCVGSAGLTALTNGNYVVSSPFWNSYMGAVTWGSGTTGVKGVITVSNSLIGSHSGTGCSIVSSVSGSGDCIGSGSASDLLRTILNPTLVTALTNGNYVVISPSWNSGTGAVTWGNGTTGTVGTVSASNSLQLGGGGFTNVVALTNGNYVVDNWQWNSFTGAVTWANGTTGITGTQSAANSLVGSRSGTDCSYAFNGGGDCVGVGSIAPLSNGNYVVSSSGWNTNAGAVTWGNGTTGTTGVVSGANSLIGSRSGNTCSGTSTSGFGDCVGAGFSGGAAFGVNVLTNGNYVVSSVDWNTRAGAATWGSGTAGVSGTISAANSLVGTNTSTITTNGCGGGGDCVGLTVQALSNGNYLVGSPQWNAGLGAVTWGNGTSGTGGTISTANSLIGSSSGASLNVAGASTFSQTQSVVVTPDAFLASSTTDGGSGRVYVGLADLNLLTYARAQAQTVTLLPSAITSVLGSGTSLTLQASNDITVNSTVTVPGSSGGALTLDAGRSILLNAGITTANGDLTLVANDTLAHGVVDAFRDPGAAVVTMASGATINAGTGNVIIDLLSGAGKTNTTSGAITLGSISANTITVENSGTSAGSDVILASGATLSTSATSGTSIALASDNGVFTNNAGATALQPGTGSRYVLFSDGLADTTLGGLTPDQSVFNVTVAQYQAGTVPSSPTGNFVLYRTPQGKVLIVTAEDAARFYGDANPTFTYQVTGFQGGDTSSILSGMPTLSTLATSTTAAGHATITVTQGTLSNSGGYAFEFVNGTLTINPRPLTYSVASTMSTYGTVASPAITFTGVVNSDSVTGTVGLLNNLSNPVTLAAKTPAGSYTEIVTALSNPNYTIAASGNATGTLTVSPLAITYRVADVSATFGTLATPGAATLNGVLPGDTVTGTVTVFDALNNPVVLAANTAIGTYAEKVTGLGGGSAPNYVVAANGNQPGVLTISAPPSPSIPGAEILVLGAAAPSSPSWFEIPYGVPTAQLLCLEAAAGNAASGSPQLVHAVLRSSGRVNLFDRVAQGGIAGAGCNDAYRFGMR
jgi:hypothetical protein